MAAEFSNELCRLNNIDESLALQPVPPRASWELGLLFDIVPSGSGRTGGCCRCPKLPLGKFFLSSQEPDLNFFLCSPATDFSVNASFYSRFEPPSRCPGCWRFLHAGTPLQRPQRSEWSLDSVWTIFADAVEASLLAASGEAQMPLDPARSIFSSSLGLLQSNHVKQTKQFHEKISAKLMLQAPGTTMNSKKNYCSSGVWSRCRLLLKSATTMPIFHFVEVGRRCRLQTKHCTWACFWSRCRLLLKSATTMPTLLNFRFLGFE